MIINSQDLTTVFWFPPSTTSKQDTQQEQDLWWEIWRFANESVPTQWTKALLSSTIYLHNTSADPSDRFFSIDFSWRPLLI